MRESTWEVILEHPKYGKYNKTVLAWSESDARNNALADELTGTQVLSIRFIKA
jgi:hypothetical protein